MKGFLDTATICVPRRAALAAHAHLRSVGQQGLEGFALWAGTKTGDSFDVQETIIPRQDGLRTAQGVCVTVAGTELHRINRWLFEHHITIIAQLHSHPSEAYHSETDDAYPIAATLGAISIVVPNFARQPFSLAECAIYRLMPKTGWTQLSQAEVFRLVRLVE